MKELDLIGTYDEHQTGYDIASNTLYLYFKDTTAIEAGKPYVIRWANGNNISDPVFANVTITNQTASVRTPFCNFLSLYSPKTFADEDPNIVYLGADNAFLQPNGTETVNIGSFRGYFRLLKLYMLTAVSTPLIIVTNLEDAVVPTDIENVQRDDVQCTKYIRNGLLFIERDGKTYNAQGQMVNDK